MVFTDTGGGYLQLRQVAVSLRMSAVCHLSSSHSLPSMAEAFDASTFVFRGKQTALLRFRVRAHDRF